MISVAVVGASGKMGSLLVDVIACEDDMSVVACIDQGDDVFQVLADSAPQVIVDFSNANVIGSHAQRYLDIDAHILIGASGLDASIRSSLEQHAQGRAKCYAVVPNFSVGMVLMQKAAHLLVQEMSCYSITETHHAQKIDAPSATALQTCEKLSFQTKAFRYIVLECQESLQNKRLSLDRKGVFDVNASDD